MNPPTTARKPRTIKGNGDNQRRFVQILFNLRIDPALTEEGHEYKAEHVEGSEAGGNTADTPEDDINVAMVGIGKCLPEDFILREKSGETGNTGNRNCRNKESNKGYRHALLQTAHVPHILGIIMRDVPYAGHGAWHGLPSRNQGTDRL